MTSEAPDDEEVQEEIEEAQEEGGDVEATEESYEVFVQWERGEPHEYSETVNAPDREMALLLAKRNVDVRSEPLSIWVAPRSAFSATAPEDTTLAPTTDRGYRNVAYYAELLRGVTDD